MSISGPTCEYVLAWKSPVSETIWRDHRLTTPVAYTYPLRKTISNGRGTVSSPELSKMLPGCMMDERWDLPISSLPSLDPPSPAPRLFFLRSSSTFPSMFFFAMHGSVRNDRPSRTWRGYLYGNSKQFSDHTNCRGGKKRNSSEILVSRTYSIDPEFLMNAENILPVVMPVRCQEHLFEDTQAARHSKSRVFEDKYSTGKKKKAQIYPHLKGAHWKLRVNVC